MVFAFTTFDYSAGKTENLKNQGDSSRYAGDQEKGLKIVRLRPNAGELTAMSLCHVISLKSELW